MYKAEHPLTTPYTLLLWRTHRCENMKKKKNKMFYSSIWTSTYI
jgi:hypothetical protein